MAELSRVERTAQAAQLLRAARFAVVFSGAGISTPSGIPDFRSASSGLWTKNDPMQVASLSAFLLRPRAFFDWLRPLAAASFRAQPNPAHTAVAELQKAGVIKAVITQNIDGLHQRAGSTDVMEVHGTLTSLTCPDCGKKYAGDDFRNALLEENQMPICPACGKILKPDVVLFEEMLPEDVWRKAEWGAKRADVIVVVGSSLEVSPANYLPYYTYEAGGRIIINTLSRTYLDEAADVLLPYDVAEVMPAIAREILGPEPG